MNVYELKTPRELLTGNSYAGRGIVIGKTPDGKKAAVAYFIMGRSANSRNRIFTEDGGTVYTRPLTSRRLRTRRSLFMRRCAAWAPTSS